MTKIKYTHRFIARIVLEAETPLFAGSGETSLINDALIQRDHHGFPMIQGTSLTGVLRHALEDHGDKDTWRPFFGYQKDDKGLGSKVKISSAYFLFPNGKVAEGLDIGAFEGYLPLFKFLPSRQHVSIDHKGVAKDKTLYEHEVVYKGCRFVFEMEVKGDGSEEILWEKLLCQLQNPLFRIGQGTRNGYGKLTVRSCRQKIFDLTKQEDFDDYLDFDPSFNANNACLENKSIANPAGTLVHYHLDLEPDSFFIFGSGYGDQEVDNTPYHEPILVYDNGELKFPEYTVIPATSIKGAISHRTCYYYNKEKDAPVHAESLDWETYQKGREPHNHFTKFIGENNAAVATLFGVGAGDENGLSHRGRIIVDDLYFSEEQASNDKILNHVAIDRLTGGSMDGKLFSEKVTQLKEEGAKIELNIWVEEWKEGVDAGLTNTIEAAFEESLKDICRGLLPLGGMTTKGHGIFIGKLFKNNEPIMI